jgi:hypothetical protein
MMRVRLTWLGSVALTFTLTLVSCSTPVDVDPPTDATPPTVVSHSPAADATNVWVQTPISAEFSKPVDPATVNDTTVHLVGPGSVNLAKLLTLSADGRSLSVAPVSSLTLPTTLSLSLTAGIRDNQGNQLTPVSWSWSLPAWLRVGDDPVTESLNQTFIYGALLALDGAGRPVVATNRETAPVGELLRWDGDAWQEIPMPVTGSGSAFLDGVAVDQDDGIVVVWKGSIDGVTRSNYYVGRWDGQAWGLFGGGLLKNAADHFPEAAAVVLDASGNPVVAWSEKTSPGNAPASLHASRWNGTIWTALGSAFEVNDDPVIQTVRIVLDPDDEPVVSWGEAFNGGAFVARWDGVGAAWSVLGGPIAPTSLAQPVTVMPDGTVVTAISDSEGRLQPLYYTQFGWQSFTTPLRVDPALSVVPLDLATTSTGALVAAWREFGDGQSHLHLARLGQEGWEHLGTPISASGSGILFHASLGLDGADVPSFAYGTFRPVTDPPGHYHLEKFYRRLNQ